MVPIGHQGRGDEGLHLRLGPVLGQVEGVDGGGDRCARFRLRVSLAAGVAVRLDEDGVVQVLKAGGQGAGHRQVPEDVAAPSRLKVGPPVQLWPLLSAAAAMAASVWAEVSWLARAAARAASVWALV